MTQVTLIVMMNLVNGAGNPTTTNDTGTARAGRPTRARQPESTVAN
ncbi:MULTISPECIES: hypothetical protein [unclassified Pseudofrankia]|nr:MULTISPECIES: hypothetical protein [unclassified Pseudofrankia]MDT3441398.1 hypothetical protein [Pseudofrankia sp. BMG5.37]